MRQIYNYYQHNIPAIKKQTYIQNICSVFFKKVLTCESTFDIIKT